MALVLDATVGGIFANSFLIKDEGDDYHESHLYSTAWDDASDAQKESALVWATRLLDDGMEWIGVIRNLGDPEQALGWPRSGVQDKEFRTIDDDVIPEPVKHATAELARKLIESDRTADRDTIGFTSIAVGSLKLSVDKLDEIAVVSDSVYDLIKDFGVRESRKGSVTLLRI